MSKTFRSLDQINKEINEGSGNVGDLTYAEMVGTVGNIGSPLLDLPLRNNLDLKKGVGAVNFQRASSATYIDRYGVLQYSEGGSVTNLLTYSEDFSNAAWTKTEVTITSDTLLAPDNTYTASKMVESTTASVRHSVADHPTTTINTDVTASVYLKAAERIFAKVWCSNSAGTQTYRIVVNLLTGEVTDTSSVSTATSVHKVEECENGWFRVSVTANTATTSMGLKVNPSTDGTSSGDTYTGDGVSGIYIWGAQIEESKFANGYVKTEATSATATVDGKPRFETDGLLVEGESTNMILSSEDMTGTGWSDLNLTISTSANLAPDGISYFQTATVDADGTNYTQQIATVAHDATYTISSFYKAGTSGTVYLDGRLDAGSNRVTYTFSTKELIGVGTKVDDYGIEYLANDVIRLWITITNSNTDTTMAIREGIEDLAGKTADMWGLQLEALPFATSYIPTTSAAVTRGYDVCTVPATNNLGIYTSTNTVHIKATSYAIDAPAGSLPNNLIAFGGDTDYFGLAVRRADTDLPRWYYGHINSLVSGTNTSGSSFTMVLNGTDALNDYLNFYTDGAFVNSDTVVSKYSVEPTTLYIGSNSALSQFLFGHVSGIKIYDKELTATEVALLG